MDSFVEYSRKADSVAIYPYKNTFQGLIYSIVGLVGESGELANKLKKIMRDQGSSILPENKEDLANELGDVLWYVSKVADELGIPLEQVAQDNIDKLMVRKLRGTLSGNGDHR